MKRLLFIMLAFFALSCGDGSNRQSEAEDRDETETMEGGDLNTDETQTSDTTQMDREMETDDQSDRNREIESDTTAADGSRRQ